jgi:GTP-binding protein
MPPHAARFLGAAADPAQVPQLGWERYPEIAFAGRSNVGKSLLLNRLVGHRRLARVSKTPGRTQQINCFLVDDRLVFADLPGYGFAHVPADVRAGWKHLVEAYLTRRPNLRAVVLLVDLRRGVEAGDAQLLDYLRARRIPALIVATKADKLRYGERVRRARALAAGLPPPVAVVVCSAVSGDGLGRLWEAIESLIAGPGGSYGPR